MKITETGWTYSALDIALLAKADTMDLVFKFKIFVGVLIPLIIVMVWVNFYWRDREKEKQEKTIESALRRIEELETNSANWKDSYASTNEPHDEQKWPWGDHHTEQLGHLSAAARRFWKLYDPSDISTAPTNKEVAKWLVNERKVSQTLADSMASILRVDGLRTGPRE